MLIIDHSYLDKAIPLKHQARVALSIEGAHSFHAMQNLVP
jgi:hypothetical protein